MKKLAFILLTAFVCSCNNGPSSTTESTTDSLAIVPAASSTMDYPYTIDHPDNWETGSNANTMIALKALKAWEENKVDESMTYFGDSVRVQFDGIDKKMSHDSLKAMLAGSRNMMKSVNEKMNDWESVISKDKTEEWVTIWYTQTWETQQGVKDSSAVINDAQIKDGKIVRLSEYNRKLH